MTELNEIAYFSDDVASMRQFYERLLGAAPLAASDGMAIFMLGATKLFIHRNYPADQAELPPEHHIALGVQDLDRACAKLQGEGLALEIPPKDYYWGRSAYLRDPDGNLIELIQGD